MTAPDLPAAPVAVPGKPRLVGKARLRHDTVRGADMLLLPERVVKLNASGGAILGLCDGERTVNQIVAELETRFDTTGLEPDVLAFLIDATSRGWITE